MKACSLNLENNTRLIGTIIYDGRREDANPSSHVNVLSNLKSLKSFLQTSQYVLN